MLSRSHLFSFSPARAALLALAIIAGVTLSAPPAEAQGYSAVTFRGIATVDGQPAPSGTVVRAVVVGGQTIGSAQTGANGLPAGSYQFQVSGSAAPGNGTRVTVTAPDFPDVDEVEVRYVPGATVTAHIAAFTEDRPPLPRPEVGKIFAAVSPFVNISPDALALDANGHSVEVVGGTLTLSASGVGRQIGVPVAMFGGVLEYLEDGVSGVTIKRAGDRMTIRIPFKNADGADTIRVLIETTLLSGTGYSAVGQVLDMSIDLPTLSRDLSFDDPRVGVASAKLLGGLSAFPSEAFMEMSLVAEPPEETDNQRLREALLAREQEPADIAFAIRFEKTVFDAVLEEATLQLSVGKEWWEAQETGSVVVVRLADDGTEQLFEFVPIDPAADPVRFDLVSPDGLSTFVITAVREATEPTPSPTATSTATPTPTPIPAPTTTAEPVASPTEAAATPTAPAESPSPTSTPAATVTPTSAPQPASTPADDKDSGSCSAPKDGHLAAGQVALLAIPLSLLALRLARRRWDF